MSDTPAPATPATPATPAHPSPTPAATPPAAASPPPNDGAPPVKTPQTIATAPDPVIDGQTPAAVPSTWPDDWRDQMAGADEKAMAKAKRYGSPQAVFNALLAAQAKISSGEYKRGLTKNSTDEEVAAYRREANIPEKPDGYELPKGLKIGDADKPLIDSYLQFAHSKLRTPAEVQDTVDWFFKAQEEQKAAAYEKDKAFHTESDDTLRAEWGNDYRGNINALRNWATKDWPPGMFDNFMGARLADGTLLGDNPVVMRQLVAWSKDIAPAASLVSAGEYQGGKGVLDRKLEIEKIMRTDRKSYDKDPAMQKEYLGIIEALEKQAKRAA